MAAARQMISAEPHGDVALALLRRGELAGEYYLGPAATVNRETVFPVASVSKWVPAAGVMQLVREKKIDLGAPVARCLTRWKLPPSQFDLGGVTTRRLLSHTSGLTDRLGFGDYRMDERVPPLVDSLRAPRASAGQLASITVAHEPGARWQYSGGGYLILQLIIEEESGQPFDAYVRQAVLGPLAMSCSSFVNVSPGNAA